MPEYLAPGVYVEEVLPSVQPIAGAGTSTAGFIGEVAGNVTLPTGPASGPLPRAGDPQLLTSWEQFKNRFGDFQVGNWTLAHAVYGFFNNGGTRCWVARIAPTATEPEEDEGEDTAGGTGDETGGTATVRRAAATTVEGAVSEDAAEGEDAETPDDAEEEDPDTIDPTAVGAALAAFEAIDEIALVAVPGAVGKTIQDAVVTHCTNMGDRFAILDGRPNPAQVTAADIRGDTGTSNYAAMYWPWLSVYDPVAKQPMPVPPSGHVAGIFARVDTARGVHKAPANEVVRGALGTGVRVSRADVAGLNPDGINTIREINGNLTVWGARTLGGDDNAAWKYINVRRLFLYLRESIDEGTQWVVFEPNTPALWSRISRNVTAFLTNVWRSGALFGNTPAEAFYVKCDADTNPPEVRDAGQVVTEIGVAVVRPAEFVIFRVSQWSGEQG